jgi:hypothetical protein
VTAELIPVRVGLARPCVLGDQRQLPWFASVIWFQRTVVWPSCEIVWVGESPLGGPVLLSKS